MNAKENGNSQAMPVPAVLSNNHRDGVYEYGAPGLTKREIFAAMAMQGLLAYSEQGGIAFDKTAPLAVKQADRLLAELAKEKP